MNFFDTLKQYPDEPSMYTWEYRRCRRFTSISYISDAGFRLSPFDGSAIMCETQNRRVDIEPNYKGHPELKIKNGDGYLMRVINLDTGAFQITTKPLRIIEENDSYIFFRGYDCRASSPFGYVDLEADDFGVMVLLDGDNIRGIVIKRYDTGNIYGYGQNGSDLGSLRLPGDEIKATVFLSEGESLINQAIREALDGDLEMAIESARDASASFVASPRQIKKVTDCEKCALVLGNYLLPDGRKNAHSTPQDVAVAYFFLMTAIRKKKHINPQLGAYKFLIEYYYNPQIIQLMKNAGGRISLAGGGPSPSEEMYERLDSMLLGDVISDKRLRLHEDVGNLYEELILNYGSIDAETIASKGSQYSDQIYEYVSQLIDRGSLTL